MSRYNGETYSWARYPQISRYETHLEIVRLMRRQYLLVDTIRRYSGNWMMRRGRRRRSVCTDGSASGADCSCEKEVSWHPTVKLVHRL
jgi:hypothetical protein